MSARDELFAASLRDATAEVPESGLDLDRVLARARGSLRRRRAVQGVAGVVAAGLTVTGAWTLTPLGADGSGPTTGIAAPSQAWAGSACVVHGFDTVGDAVTTPVDVWSDLVTVIEDPPTFSHDRTLPLGSAVVGFEVTADPWSRELEDAVILAATAEDGPFPTYPRVTLGPDDLVPDADLHGSGVYILYELGTRREVSGVAACGGDEIRFRLARTDAGEPAQYKCGDEADAFVAEHVQPYCEEPRSEQVRAIGREKDRRGREKDRRAGERSASIEQPASP